jgi:hypothetical protein
LFQHQRHKLPNPLAVATALVSPSLLLVKWLSFDCVEGARPLCFSFPRPTTNRSVLDGHLSRRCKVSSKVCRARFSRPLPRAGEAYVQTTYITAQYILCSLLLVPPTWSMDTLGCVSKQSTGTLCESETSPSSSSWARRSRYNFVRRKGCPEGC